MQNTAKLKRTSLYVSGASPINMIQAAFYNEDCLVYDLEDSVQILKRTLLVWWCITPCVITDLQINTLSFA